MGNLRRLGLSKDVIDEPSPNCYKGSGIGLYGIAGDNVHLGF